MPILFANTRTSQQFDEFSHTASNEKHSVRRSSSWQTEVASRQSGSGATQPRRSSSWKTEVLPRLNDGNESIPAKRLSAALTGRLPEVQRGRFSSAIVGSRRFRNCITAIIVLGVIQMGFEVEMHSSAFKRAWNIWDVCYTTIATIEMLLMMDAYRSIYFTNSWMLLDFALVILGILDTFVFPIASIPGDLRMFRLLRLARVLRVVKMSKGFPELAIIIDGLAQSCRSIFWSFALLLLILYAASICCVGVLGGRDSGYPAYDEATSAQVDNFNNYVYFGTVFRSMITLLGMLLLSEWGLLRKIAETHIMMVPFFVLMLVIVTFGVFNLIIGIVVEHTTTAINAPRLNQIAQDMDAKATLSEQLADLLDDIDTDGDGRASLSELEHGLRDNREFAEKLQGLDLPHNFTVVEFLSMLDSDGNGSLSKHEFVTGLMRLIFSNDWQRECLLAMEIGMLHQTVIKLAKDVTEELTHLGTQQSEFRALLHSNVTQLVSDTTRCPAGVHVAQIPRGQWEPFPEDVSVINGETLDNVSKPWKPTENELMECFPSISTEPHSKEGKDGKFESARVGMVLGAHHSCPPARKISDEEDECQAQFQNKDVELDCAETLSTLSQSWMPCPTLDVQPIHNDVGPQLPYGSPSFQLIDRDSDTEAMDPVENANISQEPTGLASLVDRSARSQVARHFRACQAVSSHAERCQKI